MKIKATIVLLGLILSGNKQLCAQDTLINMETRHFLNSLKAFTKSEFTLFGMANALTISYSGGPQHEFNDQSDARDITGSHPAMIESDFMWYDNSTFLKRDTIAMREAYIRGAVTGYCYHLRGRLSNDFYLKKDGKTLADSALVKNILASSDRATNVSLDWYLDVLDNKVIPIFKGLGFPTIFRPFHEMTGGWFWWGSESCTPAQYIQLWQLTVDYIRKAGVKNVLYAWAPDKSSDFKFYPGDEYVDIIGYDGYDIGAVDYHSTNTFVSHIAKLSDYAVNHEKVFAVTETGHGKFPATHPDYWFDHVLKPMKKNAKAKNTAWIMSWYNADWNHDLKGVSWIPYAGIEDKQYGQEAIDEFMEFYNDPRTIFLNEVPNFYYTTDNSVFIFPKTLSLNSGDSLRMMGGSKNNWFSETKTWTSSDVAIATVSDKGMVKALKGGTVNIIVTTPDAKSDTCIIVIKDVVNVPSFNNEEVSIYPNPSDGRNISFNFGSYAGIKNVHIYNVEGKKLFSFVTDENVYALNEKTFGPGFYIANIKNGNQSISKSFWVK